MSTRGWYEYYVVDDSRSEVSLALQFYKWGDATPENALAELEVLRRATARLGGRIQETDARYRDDVVSERESLERLIQQAEAGHGPERLADILQSRRSVPSDFWDQKLPRGAYLGP